MTNGTAALGREQVQRLPSAPETSPAKACLRIGDIDREAPHPEGALQTTLDTWRARRDQAVAQQRCGRPSAGRAPAWKNTRRHATTVDEHDAGLRSRSLAATSRISQSPHDPQVPDASKSFSMHDFLHPCPASPFSALPLEGSDSFIIRTPVQLYIARRSRVGPAFGPAA